MLITFEGIDACGKSTQLRLLEDELLKQGYSVLKTRQPGGTEIGASIREILLNPNNKSLSSDTEVLLYLADRLQHINDVIKPALQEGKIILCDRYQDATTAYQGGGRGLDLSWTEPILTKHVIEPDLTLWFDISVEESQKRLALRNLAENVENCRMENQEREFFLRVIGGYEKLCQIHPERIKRIDGALPVDAIKNIVLDEVNSRLT